MSTNKPVPGKVGNKYVSFEECTSEKKVLILSGSPRKGGNSDTLCDEFLRGAAEAGNQVEKIRVAEKKIGYCSACYYCRDHGGVCAKKDDMAELLQKMIDADVIVLASPVYFYSICAQMKTVIDRSVARWTEIKNKEFYYIVTSAEEEKRRRSVRSNASGALPTAWTVLRKRASSMPQASMKRARSRTARL